MRRMLLLIASVALLCGVGCNHHNLSKGHCSSCNGGGAARAADYVPRAPQGGGMPGGGMQAGGPAVGAIAYPYYTTRGPRDFLNPAPPSIGP